MKDIIINNALELVDNRNKHLLSIKLYYLSNYPLYLQDVWSLIIIGWSITQLSLINDYSVFSYAWEKN